MRRNTLNSFPSLCGCGVRTSVRGKDKRVKATQKGIGCFINQPFNQSEGDFSVLLMKKYSLRGTIMNAEELLIFTVEETYNGHPVILWSDLHFRNRSSKGKCVIGRMRVEDEGESLIPFIDEGEEHELKIKEGKDGPYNLTITRNYQNKTRRVEISKILQDVEPITNRSLSPVAPLAYESDTDGGKSDLTELTGAEFELTIKSNNSVIRIQGFDNKSTIAFNSSKAKGENVHDYLSKELDKIFKKPEKEEIEKAMRSVKDKRKLKPICRQKRNTWKALAKSIVGLRGGKSAQRRGSIERYPKMVLLQDPKSPPAAEELYPKMVALDGNKENEKHSLRLENEKIERCKMDLSRGKKLLKEETKMLNKKKDTVQDKKMNLGDSTADERFRKKEMDIIAEEKLCVELEKQLLGEKDILREEMDLLKKEKEVLQKERDLLEGEKSLEDDVKGATVRAPSGAKRILPQQLQQHSFDAEELSYASVPPFYCQYPTHCPYIPVYSSRPLPYCHYNEICCSGRAEPPTPQKDSSTQTDLDVGQQIETLDPDKDMDLPFGILSSLFPRIVVMKSFQEEVSSDEAQIYEIPKSEILPPGNEKEDEKDCEESQPEQPVDVELDPEPKDAEKSSGSASEESMPLTKIGYSIYEKLNELAIEREKEAKELAAVEGEQVEMMETETGKSPRDVTLEISNRIVNFTLGDENLNFEVADGSYEKTVVRKSDLWHPSNGISRRCGDPARDPDQICVSVSDNRNVIFTVRVGAERKWTSEAKVGTDGIDIAGGDFVSREGIDSKNLSPRTDKALRTLRDKLDKVGGNKTAAKKGDFKFPGLFLIQPFDSRNRGFPGDDYIMTKERWRRSKDVSAEKAREYYCEDCLATMRLIEDENPTVKTMVDKFERIIHLGSY